MGYFYIILSLVLFACVCALVTSYVCFFRIFLSRRKKTAAAHEEYPIPEGKIYEERREQMIEWIKLTRSAAHKEYSITSFDGLRLCGRYYEYSPDAPIELLMHGYKGSAERDLSGGIARCFSLGHSVFVFDHRASGDSEGRVISFGVNESRDCLLWVDFIINNINKDARIIIAGISMGGATAAICAGEELPSNVIGVVADCGYTSAEDIIKKVMDDMGLPSRLLYPFARLGARIFGRFDPAERSPISAMKSCRVPIIFFHGDVDDYVPCFMSEQNYEACAHEKKRLVVIEGAGHGLCFPVDKQRYLDELRDFFGEC